MQKTVSILTSLILAMPLIASVAYAAEEAAEPPQDEITENIEEIDVSPIYLQAVLSGEDSIEVTKSAIFEASKSFIPDTEKVITYEWDFGDGNRNEGIEVLHAYKDPGKYTVTLTMSDGVEISEVTKEIFAYNKLITLITDKEDEKERIETIKDYAEREGVQLKVIESFGSSTEFISEEILTKKLREGGKILMDSEQIIIWTKETSGLTAISRYRKSSQEKTPIDLSEKNILILSEDIAGNRSRIQRQFELISPKNMVISKEAAIYPAIKSSEKNIVETLEKEGHEYEIINASTGKIRAWNFMSYFVNFLVNKGIPDNTIALLLLLPIIATVVAIMKQVVGITTFGIYTPSIITLSFLVIGMPIGLLTLFTAISIGAISRPILKRVRMLFIPKMAIVLTVVSLALFLILILSTYLELFNAEFLSIAIFPMVILSTLVEKFISVKTEKGLSSASILMAETVFVSIIAYFIVGGEINLGITNFKFDAIKIFTLAHPEIIFLLIFVNLFLGKWSGVRLLEYIRFREVLRHLEE